MLKLFKSCCQDTTAHGFPNVVSEKSQLLRFSWMIFVLCAAGVYAFHGSTLIIQFMSEPTAVTETPYALEFVPPDIYFCRRQPLSLSYIESEEYQENEDYLKIKEVMNDMDNMDQKAFNNIEMLWQTISMETMFNTLGNIRQQNLLHFYARNFDGSLASVYEYVESVPHWKHFSCLRFQTFRMNFTGQPSKIRAWYFTDAQVYEEEKVKLYKKPLSVLPMSHVDFDDVKSDIGFEVYVVPQGEYPHIDAASVSASVSQLTEVVVQMKLKDMLNKKTAPCSKKYEEITYVNIIDSASPITFNGTAWDCVYKIFHEAAMRECGCTTHIYPITVEQEKVGVKFCLNLTEVDKEDYEELIIRRDCIDVVKKNLRKYEKMCQEKNLCKTPVYNLRQKSYDQNIQTVLNTNLSATTKSVGPGLTKFEEMRKDPNISALNLMKLSQNLQEIVVHPGETFCPEMKEDYTYLIKNLASDLGGLLGFYMGISFVTACELLGFVIESFFLCCKKKDKNPNYLNEDVAPQSVSTIETANM